MALTERIEQLIAPTIESMGYEVVRVQLIGDHDPRLQIMAERQDGRAMHVDDCADLSRAISALLDVEDPIVGAYTLEVSSPGIDRPLTRVKDFERFAGFEAKVETQRPVGGRKRFRGKLIGIDGGQVRMRVDGVDVDVPYDDIAKARLVLTDELLAAAKIDQAS